jgi:hypothetical protein
MRSRKAEHSFLSKYGFANLAGTLERLSMTEANLATNSCTQQIQGNRAYRPLRGTRTHP